MAERIYVDESLREAYLLVTSHHLRSIIDFHAGEGEMHIQIINFRLKDVTEEDYAGLCDNLAPSYAAVPGLVRKIWLANSQTRTYGGVYVWRDKQAMEDFARTDLYNSVATHPNLDGVTSVDFDVLPGPTQVTNGSI
jgi:hypothetical protein